MRIQYLWVAALLAALLTLPAQASQVHPDTTTASFESCFRVHVVYAMKTPSGELVPQIKTCLSRENADEFQSCFSHSVAGGFDARQAVDACRAKYNVSLFEGHI